MSVEGTKFQKGDLVWVLPNSIRDNERRPGIVMDIRPWVLGGSGVQSWTENHGDHLRMSRIVHEPKRSEYLIISPTGDFQSWFDENHVEREK